MAGDFDYMNPGAAPKKTGLFDFSSLIDPAVSLGFKALSDKIAPDANMAATKESGRQFDVRTKRSDEIRQRLMPNLATNLGMSSGQMNPAMLRSPSFGASGGSVPQGPGAGKQILGAGLGVASSVLPKLIAGKVGGTLGGLLGGGAGTGLGLGASLASGALTAGLGAAVPFAIQGIHKLLTPAHKQADKLTGEGGLAREFDARLGELYSSPLSQEERENAIRYLYDKLQQDSAGFASEGGDQNKVVQQMLAGYKTNPVTAAALRGY